VPPYCVVGVIADAGAVVGISTISGIPAVVVLPSAVNSVMFLLSMLCCKCSGSEFLLLVLVSLSYCLILAVLLL
jgi:hypothetical protein